MKDDDPEKRARTRAKNRKAQAKYRQKLKSARAETESALDQAIADVERLRLENARLLTNNDAMERVLDVRDATAGILEEGKKAHEVDLQVRTTFKALTASKSAPPDHRPGDNGAPGDDNKDCPLKGLSTSEIAALKNTRPETIANHYSMIVKGVRDALALRETDPSAGTEAMHAALWEAGCFCWERAVLQPTTLQRLMAAEVNDGVEAEADPQYMQRWRDITAGLGLSEEQKQDMAAPLQVFKQRIARVKEQRRAALEKLQAAALPAGGDESLLVLQQATARWLKVNAASQDLSASMQEEHVACMELVARVFGRTMTPLQKAQVMVAAHPQFPDAFAIASEAAGMLAA